MSELRDRRDSGLKQKNHKTNQFKIFYDDLEKLMLERDIQKDYAAQGGLSFALLLKRTQRETLQGEVWKTVTQETLPSSSVARSLSANSALPPR